MTEPKEVEVPKLAEAPHVLELLQIVSEAAKTPKLSSIAAVAMNELLSLNDDASDQLAEYADAVAKRDAEIKKAADDAAAKAAAEEEAKKPKEKAA